MPDSKITELPAITTLVDADVLPIVDLSDDTTKKVTIAQIKTQAPVQSVNGSTGAVTVQETLVSGTNIKTINSTSILGSGDITISGSVAWGGITGTLGSQTDLQSALDGKEATITAGTTAQYYRGDKSFQTLDKTAVGLSNVDNTSDANKPVSTATQTALDGKVDENTAITGATKTKITYDAKGLVTTGADLAASDLPTAIDATKIADGTVTNAEFQYLGGVTSDVQTQLDGKIAKSTGTTYNVYTLSAVTQAEYNALTPNADTIYFII